MTTLTQCETIKATFQGINASGNSSSITVLGLKAGDIVISVTGADAAPYSNLFSHVITADDTINQWTSSDLSGLVLTAVVVRPVATP